MKKKQNPSGLRLQPGAPPSSFQTSPCPSPSPQEEGITRAHADPIPGRAAGGGASPSVTRRRSSCMVHVAFTCGCGGRFRTGPTRADTKHLAGRDGSRCRGWRQTPWAPPTCSHSPGQPASQDPEGGTGEAPPPFK